MKILLYKIFISNWPRKLISLGLALIIWVFVNHSITITKTFHNVPVKVINVPKNKIIKELDENNFLTKKLTITLAGNKNILEDLTGSDLEIVLDATGKSNEWEVNIYPKNLRCLNPEIDIQKNVNKVFYPKIVLHIKDLNKKTPSEDKK